ncbi:hypothetical protein EQG49_04305 [Periweissella cryptocerci]|uniref:Uncharacterized protein n=1 Tax=Periweissella cryptocerci TaxID=2506420 RepID=A0A4P6YSX6_9LACO|nr:hypothetical protein [Periweissella cryptocerci]QBO35737.1 hypothetical protein EQG49_04305 [Periweissella cryptocerci]
MQTRKKLWALVKAVNDGEITINTFTEEFTIIFDRETDYTELSEREETEFNELVALTSRYSPFLEDFEIQNTFSSAAEILIKVAEILELGLDD